MSYFSPTEQRNVLQPLLNRIQKLHKPEKTVILGIQGGQGTGKTTLARYLQEELQQNGFAVDVFSLDDFYLSAKKRKRLATKYPDNPYYQISRGLPGTHRAKYLLSVLQKIQQGKKVKIPIFDKSLQEAYGDIAGYRTIGKQDFIIVEGWCLGIPEVSVKELVQICTQNKISLRKIDQTLEHSKIILKHIKPYQQLWKYLDYLLMLKPDSPALHTKWRWQQEGELKKKTGKGMSKKEIRHFVRLFLPFTYVCYEKVKADIKLLINKKHEFYPTPKYTQSD